MGNFCGTALRKISIACRWVMSKLEASFNHIKEKITQLFNHAKRYFDNVSDSLKESISNSKRVSDTQMDQIDEKVKTLKAKLSQEHEKKDVSEIAKLFSSLMGLIRRFFGGDILSAFLSGVRLVEIAVNKSFANGFEDDIRRGGMCDEEKSLVWYLASGILQLISMCKNKPFKIAFVIVEATKLLNRKQNSVTELMHMENVHSMKLGKYGEMAVVFVYFALTLTM